METAGHTQVHAFITLYDRNQNPYCFPEAWQCIVRPRGWSRSRCRHLPWNSGCPGNKKLEFAANIQVTLVTQRLSAAKRTESMFEKQHKQRNALAVMKHRGHYCLWMNSSRPYIWWLLTLHPW